MHLLVRINLDIFDKDLDEMKNVKSMNHGKNATITYKSDYYVPKTILSITNEKFRI